MLVFKSFWLDDILNRLLVIRLFNIIHLGLQKHNTFELITTKTLRLSKIFEENTETTWKTSMAHSVFTNSVQIINLKWTELHKIFTDNCVKNCHKPLKKNVNILSSRLTHNNNFCRFLKTRIHTLIEELNLKSYVAFQPYEARACVSRLFYDIEIQKNRLLKKRRSDFFRF